MATTLPTELSKSNEAIYIYEPVNNPSKDISLRAGQFGSSAPSFNSTIHFRSRLSLKDFKNFKDFKSSTSSNLSRSNLIQSLSVKTTVRIGAQLPGILGL